MSTHSGNIEGWLNELGKARSHRAFAGTSGRYPWQKPEPKIINLLHRRLAWARVAATFAAAAGVAVLFVAPALFHKPGVTSITPNVSGTSTTENSNHVAVTVAAGSSVGLTCDYNGDGVVNGRDIQPFLDHVVRGSDGNSVDLAKLTKQFQGCLLGSM